MQSKTHQVSYKIENLKVNWKVYQAIHGHIMRA